VIAGRLAVMLVGLVILAMLCLGAGVGAGRAENPAPARRSCRPVTGDLAEGRAGHRAGWADGYITTSGKARALHRTLLLAVREGAGKAGVTWRTST